MGSLVKKFIKKRNSRVKLNEVTQLYFLKRLHRLLNNGYPLITALEVLNWDKQMKQAAVTITISLKKGYFLDEAFSHAQFHELITAYLYFVRVNDNLISNLEKCIVMFEQRITYINKFKQVIRYPIVLFIVFILLLLFIKQSILPSFVELFQSSTSSFNTVMFSIMIIDFLTTLFFIGLFIISIGFIAWYYYKQKIPIESQLSLYNRIPIYRNFLRLQTTYYFASHMSMFLKTGMSMKNILKNMSEQKKLPIISYYSNLMTNHLSNGYFLADFFIHVPLLDRQLGSIFQKNNHAESLEKDLAAYAEFIAEYLEQKILRIITLIQPIFFVTLACFIIFFYLTLMWPMFQLINTI